MSYDTITAKTECLPDPWTADTIQDSQQEEKSCSKSGAYTRQLKQILWSCLSLIVMFSSIIGHLWWTFCECTPGIAWGDRTFVWGRIWVYIIRSGRGLGDGETDKLVTNSRDRGETETTRGWLSVTLHCALAFISKLKEPLHSRFVNV